MRCPLLEISHCALVSYRTSASQDQATRCFKHSPLERDGVTTETYKATVLANLANLANLAKLANLANLANLTDLPDVPLFACTCKRYSG